MPNRHCRLLCDGAETPWGYQEIAQETGGQLGSLCVTDLGQTLEGYLEDITGAASPLKLTRTPVSASLKLTVGGNGVARSRQSGFDYRGSANAVVLLNQSYTNKTNITAAYSFWK